MTFKDAVKILGVDLAASKKEIRNAYRTLVAKNHPDKFQDDVDKKIAEKNFRKIQEAYEFLDGLMPAVSQEDRMTRSGYSTESDKIKENLDSLLKINPVSGDNFHWSDVSSTQTIIVKFIVYTIPIYVLVMVIFFKWPAIKEWFSSF